jgi:peptide/nickel transport system ATP-binding protein
MTAALTVEGLRIGFGRGRDALEVVKGVTFTVEEGEAVAIVGESGSGKSVTARSLVGLTGEESTVRADALRLRGQELQGLAPKAWREIRGREVGFVLQDALVSLDPLRTIGREIEEPLRRHFDWTSERRAEEVIELLRSVGVPEPEIRQHQRPHELSGGLRQRALIASAIAARPQLLILDEATTALDVTVQAQILRLLDTFKQEGRTLLIITHDLAVVSQIADRVLVMTDGQLVEAGATGEVFTAPKHPYTRRLLDAIPSNRPHRVPAARGDVVATVAGVGKTFRLPGRRELVALDDLSFTLRAGRTLGVVGESGSGKSTAGRILLGLSRPDEGEVRVGGLAWNEVSGRAAAALRRRIQAVHQDPLSSFDPRHSVRQILSEAVGVLGGSDRSRRRARVLELLDQVGLGTGLLERRPFQLSGGQRQRVAIARALALEPEIIVADEPVSALDVSIQAQVLDLFVDIQRETNVALLFISHDLGVVRALSDDVLVLKDGRTVEHDTADVIFRNPSAPYTRELLAAVPRIDHHRVATTASDEYDKEAIAS